MSFEGTIGYSADGGFKQTHCILQDITNQRRAEKTSAENAFRFQSLFNEMSAGAAIYKVRDDGQYGKDYIIQDFNKAALKAEGKEKEDVLGKSLYDLRPNIDNYGLIPVFQEVWKTGKPACFPTKMYVDEKFSNWYENSIFKLPSEEIVAIFEDVTEKMRAQEIIRKQNDIFVSLLKLLPVGVLMVDATEGKPLVINDMGKALLGSEIFPDANDHNLSEVYKAYKGDTQEHYPIAEMPIMLGMKGVNSHIDDMIVERPDGTRILLEVFGTPINDVQGKPWASLVTFMDITDRKKIEKELYLSERKYRTIIETTQDGIWVINIEGQITDVNETYCRMIGYTKTELLGMKIADLDVLETPLETAKHIKWLMENGSDLFETRHKKKDGNLLDIEVSATYVDSNDTISVFCRDITKRKEAEKQLQQSMDDLLESQRVAHLGTWRLDLATNEVQWSEELYNLYGFDPTIPPPPYTEHMKLFTRESWEKLSTSLERTSISGIPYELELETVRLGGSNGWMWVRGEAVTDSNNKIVSLRGTAQDITDRKKNENELVYLSVHDHLTGLYNRRFFEQELKNLDTTKNLPLSVIMCDVNGLKLINDSFGHDSGDTLLKKAAKTIKKVCPEEGIVARIGGDEFVLLLPKTSARESVEIANQIKELASKEKVANIELSISYGYDTKTDDNQSIVEIIANAENHMYRHKLYERSSIRSKTIDLIMNALFEKSKREAAHSKRVSSICQSIAFEMKMDVDAVNQMKIAGLIHDIGKIGVDESILNKPGSLTIEERSHIEKHPEIGWRLLSSTNEFSKLAQFVLNHHERWDGCGYPNGLKGEEIQIEARIIAVADAYDAMTSERSYRKALSKKESIKELMKCSGTHFDPEIVTVFVNQVLMVLDFNNIDNNNNNLAKENKQ
jgi:diguanylate cyclase